MKNQPKLLKLLVILPFVFAKLTCSGQNIDSLLLDASVEKRQIGIDLGLISFHAYHESQLTRKVTLRQEIGMHSALVWTNGDFSHQHEPYLSIEIRNYYNLAKRIVKKKSIVNNSANFYGLGLIYVPGSMVISSDNGYYEDGLFLLPKWGIRRTMTKHLSFETGVGLAIDLLDLNISQTIEDDGLFSIIYPHLRIGYVF